MTLGSDEAAEVWQPGFYCSGHDVMRVTGVPDKAEVRGWLADDGALRPHNQTHIEILADLRTHDPLIISMADRRPPTQANVQNTLMTAAGLEPGRPVPALASQVAWVSRNMP